MSTVDHMKGLLPAKNVPPMPKVKAIELNRRYVFGLVENPTREQIKAEIERLVSLL